MIFRGVLDRTRSKFRLNCSQVGVKCGGLESTTFKRFYETPLNYQSLGKLMFVNI